MRESPILLVVVSGEQAIVDAIAQLCQPSTDILAEALLVTDLIHQLLRSDEDPTRSECCQREDLACLKISIFDLATMRVHAYHIDLRDLRETV